MVMNRAALTTLPANAQQFVPLSLGYHVPPVGELVETAKIFQFFAANVQVSQQPSQLIQGCTRTQTIQIFDQFGETVGNGTVAKSLEATALI